MAAHQGVINVMDAARRAGLVRLTFATQSTGRGVSAAAKTPCGDPRRSQGDLAARRRGAVVERPPLLHATLVGLATAWLPCRLLRRAPVPVPVIVVGNPGRRGAGKTR